MRNLTIILFSITLLIAQPVGDCDARDEVRGIVSRMSDSEIVLETENRDTRRFSVDRSTRAFIMGRSYPASRITRGSRARVVREQGRVTVICVEEAPR